MIEPVRLEILEPNSEQHDLVCSFQPVAVQAGDEAYAWLTRTVEDPPYGIVTYLLRTDERLEAFFATRAGEITLHERTWRKLRKPHPSHGVLLIAWAGRHRESGTGITEIANAATAVARRLAGEVGIAALAADPTDRVSASIWSGSGFRTCQAPRARYGKRLWKPLT